MKRLLLSLLALITCCGITFAQYETEVTIKNIYNNPTLVSNAENALTSLFTELNNAHAQQRVPQLKNIRMEEAVRTSVLNMWENSRFRCNETDIVCQGRKVFGTNEYEVRNIPFIFTDMEPDFQRREVAITFNPSGQITSFHITVESNEYHQLMQAMREGRGSEQVTTDEQKWMILRWVEQFRTAYESKDIAFIEQVFSDDALIITGTRKQSAQKANTDNFVSSARVDYIKQTKKQYINRLKGIFGRNERIRVTFDNIEVEADDTKPGWYGVNLLQGWTAGSGNKGRDYHDDGYLFLLWDFTDEEKPQIHVRVWEDINDVKADERTTLEDMSIRL